MTRTPKLALTLGDDDIIIDLKVDPVERSHSDAVGAELMSDTRHPDR